ncbi:MAG: hypothetical protein WC442_05855 [Candidatus Omnitrophota bacterium]
MDKKLLFALIILILPVILFAESISEQSDYCKSMRKDIESEIAKSNFCFTDVDCDVLELGGRLIRFGCYHFVNKTVDKEALYQRMQEYYAKCDQAINDCAKAPQPTCVNNKCVAFQQSEDKLEEKIY